ncbi:MAG: CREA protein [Alphaproteobacteria bacterium RIFCSPHIGHO2_12_FULL_63_12]|nr:MAG: CREA protein [Alphaproteobacteria bacterium RIFCSPHIGHO2_12_FULL_63_12]
MRKHLLPIPFLLLAACGAGQHEEVGEFKNDLIGNEIKLEALKDPKVDGVTCHLSYFDRAVWDRLAKGNWFENPSNSSIACRQTGAITIGDIDLDKSGEEVFSQAQSLIFKQLAVRRIYDADNNTLIYVAFTRKPVEGSAKMSISSISLYGQDVAVPAP